MTSQSYQRKGGLFPGILGRIMSIFNGSGMLPSNDEPRTTNLVNSVNDGQSYMEKLKIEIKLNYFE